METINETILIEDAHYEMDMGCGGDLWRFSGTIVCGHPYINPGKKVMTSTPLKFDEENLTLETASGRKYKILSFGVNREKTIEQIKKDVQCQATEVH